MDQHFDPDTDTIAGGSANIVVAYIEDTMGLKVELGFQALYLEDSCLTKESPGVQIDPAQVDLYVSGDLSYAPMSDCG
jgi:hypothetical protein